jgi:hypothetical protein
MENKITYKEVSGAEVAVFLEGRRVGTIRPMLAGFRYFPLGQRQGGEKYQTLAEVKRSLEG